MGSQRVRHEWATFNFFLNKYMTGKRLFSYIIVQSLSCVQPFGTPWTVALQGSLSFNISQSLLKFMSIEFWCYIIISPSSLFTINLSQHQHLFQWVTSGGQSIGVSGLASVLPVNIQGWSPLELTGLISLPFKGLSRVFSSITIQKHQFFVPQPSLCSNSYICTRLLEKP